VEIEQEKPAEPEPDPLMELVFNRIEAPDIAHVILYFDLTIHNLRSAGAQVDLPAPLLQVNGRPLPPSASGPTSGFQWAWGDQETPTETPYGGDHAVPAETGQPLRVASGDGGWWAAQKAASELPEYVEPYETYLVGVWVEVNTDWLITAAGLSERGEVRGFVVGLTQNAVLSYADGPVALSAAAQAEFPRIQPPNFIITGVRIIRAELINTRFLVMLRIENPNFFPLELSEFTYELYGNGRFWAAGTEQSLGRVSAQGVLETELSLMMNFINMNRQILDQVTNLRQVAYRFTGEAAVGTGLDLLPHFRFSFNRSGNTDVAP
jgi:LEA14-like dessication related protein